MTRAYPHCVLKYVTNIFIKQFLLQTNQPFGGAFLFVYYYVPNSECTSNIRLLLHSVLSIDGNQYLLGIYIYIFTYLWIQYNNVMMFKICYCCGIIVFSRKLSSMGIIRLLWVLWYAIRSYCSLVCYASKATKNSRLTNDWFLQWGRRDNDQSPECNWYVLLYYS